MNELTKTRLFAILSEPSQKVLTSEMQNAYGNFVEHIKEVCSSGDNTAIYRCLSITRIEFAALQSIHQYEQGEKCA